jgi:hypothetical protein
MEVLFADPDLAAVIKTRTALPSAIRAGIVAMIPAVRLHSSNPLRLAGVTVHQ